MISSYGTVSVRWLGDDFLITPTNVLRWNIMVDDIVQIKDGKRESVKFQVGRRGYIRRYIDVTQTLVRSSLHNPPI